MGPDVALAAAEAVGDLTDVELLDVAKREDGLLPGERTATASWIRLRMPRPMTTCSGEGLPDGGS